MEKIAVIGMSCLFPGAKDPHEFFQNLLNKKDTTSFADEDQMGVDPNLFFASKKGVADKYYSKRGGFIKGFRFDSKGYQIPADDLEKLDDIYQWSLYVAKEALKNSGYLNNKAALEKTGVALGNLSFPTKSSNKLFLPIYTKAINETLNSIDTGNPVCLETDPNLDNAIYQNSRISGYPATIIAKALGLKGGHFALDAACASSLYSVKLACDYLITRKADLMLAGSVSAADPLFVNLGFSTFQAYPEDDISCPLDVKSGGLVAGEGAGMFVLKRYKDAIRDKDPIEAVICGIGLSNDGRGKFALSPNPKGQKLSYERAYKSNRTKPELVSYIECHATGTPLGDITEVNSLEDFFGSINAEIKVGSVKTNFGHLLTTAGMASMMKIICSMTHSVIPPTINVSDPIKSSEGFIDGSKIVTSEIRWQKNDDDRFAAVNAFGFGGTNAHLVFQSVKTAKKEDKIKSQRPLADNKLKSLSIIGMEAHFGSAKSLEEFGHYIYSGKQDKNKLPKDRWKGVEENKKILSEYDFHKGSTPKGAFIDHLDIDYLRFKIPPNPKDPLIAQQLLMLQVADNALKDSGLKEGSNVAVLIAMETDPVLHQLRGRIDLDWQIDKLYKESKPFINDSHLNKLKGTLKESIQNPVGINQFTSFIGNIMACRVSSLWDLTGPAFTISSEENSVFRAIEIAQMMLNQGEVDAVVVGAVDLYCSLENLF
ncbi:MAG: 3-hydroxyacyl-[acyl-carrier-protein] dehydratase FabA, partial [Proteobacteria bacterium]|nr:3-hydroxyacyl-[acyl-carrier-protein] dehydratase FabA [Pseudomonadota bacterium]